MRILILLVGLCLGAVLCRGQLIVNGDFESPVLGSNLNFSGAISFTGWAGQSTGGSGNAGLVVGENFGLAPLDGNQAFSFNGNDPAAGTYIEQTIATTIGAEYTVTFHLARSNSLSGTLEARFVAYGAGDGELVNSFHYPAAVNTWQQNTATFVADSTSTRLRWTDTSTSNPTADLFIDGVSASVSAIPEPGTYAAWAGALALVGVVWNRRRRGQVAAPEGLPGGFHDSG